MEAILSDDFLIIGLCRLLKSISHSCVTCRRAYQRTQHQMMGHLPTDRTRPELPLTIVGVDFAGSLTTTKGNPCKPILVKTYICIFVCFSTRAVHLELCVDLSADTFLSAFRSFTSRRSIPSQVYCDNWRNFVGAARDLQDIESMLKSTELQHKTTSLTTNNDIQWHF